MEVTTITLRRAAPVWIAAVATCFGASGLLGCTVQQDLGNRPTDAGTGDGGGSPDGSMQPPSCTAPATDLHGTWDLLGAANGSTPATGTLILGDDSLSIAFGTTSLSFNGTSSPVLWTDSEHGEVSITANRMPSTVDLGLLPLDLGGAWTFGNGADGCNASLSATTFNATCTGGVEGLPEPLPDTLAGSVNATKTASLPSVFGSLGGTWSAQFQQGSCTASFSGNVITIDCNDEETFHGSVQASFCNGLVSGSTSDGVAFTGRLQ
jgi:hypothetical protein